MERWKSIEEAPAYQISNRGNVRSLERTLIYMRGGVEVRRVQPAKVLRPTLDKDGYHVVNLWCDGKAMHRPVHRLVAFAFLGSPRGDQDQVMHKDDVRTNNKVRNLRWGTNAENMNDRNKKGRTAYGSRVGVSKLTDSQVKQILTYLWFTAFTLREISLMYGVSIHTISQIKLGKRWKHIYSDRSK